jgi:lipopolysaccharide/colanic/teichoic acid biosynthesis glycosyltransferase
VTNILQYPPPTLTTQPHPLEELANDPSEIRFTREQAFGLLKHRPTPLWKRLFDILACFALLVIASPLLVAIAIFIRCVSSGPIFFRQKRLGEMGKDFEILKFRTLHPSPTATEDHRRFIASLNAENKVVGKPDLANRMIPGGKFLRAWSLDELPQLINILKGEMSLIGPRPDVLAWYDYEPEQLRRFETAPGLTGLWQVSGKNRLTFGEMIDLDVKYVENRSLWLDLKILFKTVRVILFRDNG